MKELNFLMKPIMKPMILASALAVLGAASAAHADMTIVQNTKIDSPQLKAYMESMTPAQRTQMSKMGNPLLSGAPLRSTIYIHGTKTRADVGSTSYIVDSATKKTLLINRRNHTYTVKAYQAAAPQGTPQAKVKDTGQNKLIGGHMAHRYLLSATIPAQPGTLIQGDVWTTRDIAQPPSLSGGGPLSSMQNVFKQIKGFPLKSTLAVTGSPLGSTTVTTSLVSISKSALPASAFAVPAGYKKTEMNAGM